MLLVRGQFQNEENCPWYRECNEVRYVANGVEIPKIIIGLFKMKSVYIWLYWNIKMKKEKATLNYLCKST